MLTLKITPIEPEHAERFRRHVAAAGPDDCWLWTGRRDTHGYGRFVLHGKRRFAHRVAWALANGKDPSNLLVCHHCDNPRCVNPSHLFVGTQIDNIADMDAKGRRAPMPQPEPTYGPHKARLGESNGSAKLTNEAVREIRRLAATGSSQSSIARLYGITQVHVSDIIRRHAWRHID